YEVANNSGGCNNCNKCGDCGVYFIDQAGRVSNNSSTAHKCTNYYDTTIAITTPHVGGNHYDDLYKYADFNNATYYCPDYNYSADYYHDACRDYYATT
ncbi:MAG: hypothetical protein QW434_06180, partial [Pyrobaculum sp.]